MVELLLLVKGILLGLAVAAPIGPIGTLCINRTIERGFLAGVSAGIGSALCDGLFAIIAAAGFAAADAFLDRISVPLQVVGGLVILIVGMRTMRRRPAGQAASVAASNIIGTIISTFFITLTNPATILGFTALFAAAGLADAQGLGPVFLVAGVFSGSLLWWFILCGATNWLHRRMPDNFGYWVSRVSGVVLIAFGLISFGFGMRALAFG